MSIADEIQSTLDDVFAQLGEAATYTPDGGSAVSVTVMPSQETETFPGPGGLQFNAEPNQFDVRVTEVADPEEGAVLLVGAVSYTIRQADYVDSRRLLWRLMCKEGA